MEGVSSTTLFETVRAKGRAAYKVYAASMVICMSLIWFYRARHGPEKGEEGRWAWMGMLGAEIWFGFYWIITQSARWRPVYRRTFKERLAQRCGTELPGVDIFVCTADPVAEPPTMVISTVLSVMAYDYPSAKLSVYVSDDAASELTFYALWETSLFARHWLPFCRRFNIEPRSPSAYFFSSSNPYYSCNAKEWSSIKEMYEGMATRIGSVVAQGKVPEELKQQHKGFSKWNPTMTSRNHQSIVQILIDGSDQDVVDMDGNQLPSLVYMAREKRPMYQHNFKAGAMNALIRVSSEISNSPIILNVDCDMYSNNSESIRNALCFFLDEEEGHNVGFVQFPQNFDNVTKNDLYSNSLRVINEVELPGLDSWGGPMYVGTGCFHRRESLCGRKYSRDYKENWKRGTLRKVEESPYLLEDRAMSLATCTYEKDTHWGKEIGLKYGFPVEDIITGLSIHCRGWKSIYFNPARKGFLGVVPATLAQTLVQHKRWSEGMFQIFTSKYCPFLYGHGKMKLGLQMGYSIYCLWAANSLPFLYYVVVTSLCLLKGISLFPKMSSSWFIPFAYVTLAKQTYSLVESLWCGDTLLGWWNMQRMWVFKRVSSYLFATTETILKLLGVSQMAFTITVKVIDEDVSKRYEQEVLEFGASSSMYVVIGAYTLLNLACLMGGMKRIMVDEGIHGLDQMVMHVLLCVAVVLINGPVYNAMFFRKDKGSMPSSVMFVSFCIVILACLLPLVFFFLGMQLLK